MSLLPLSNVYDLAGLTESGAEVFLPTTEEQRNAIAAWASLDGVERFEARIQLKRLAANRFSYTAVLDAAIVQSCVVTLEPVRSKLGLEISRTLHLVRSSRGATAEPLEDAPEENDGPEQIQDTRFDLAGPLLEEFSLAIDPYPRAPGVTFAAEPEPRDPSDSPFAVLKSLDRGG